MQGETRTCDECKENMIPFPTLARPTASEYYCTKCHKSKTMTEEEMAYWCARKRASKQ